MTQDLLESIEGGIATLTMNRPEVRNAFSREMMDALSEALPRLANDPAVRLVVLTGTGAAFSAGGDVKGFAGNAGGAPVSVSFDHKVTDLRARMEVSRWLHEMPKPTLAVIPGPAAGAGLLAGRWPATCASPPTTPSSPPPSRRSACPATSAAATSSTIWSARPRRARCTSPAR